MQSGEILTSPGGLLIAAAIAFGAGVVSFLAGNLMMKAGGDSIESSVERSSQYRKLDTFEHLNAFFSDPRNIPVYMAMGGLFLIFVSVCGAIGGCVWFLVQALAS